MGSYLLKETVLMNNIAKAYGQLVCASYSKWAQLGRIRKDVTKWMLKVKLVNQCIGVTHAQSRSFSNYSKNHYGGEYGQLRIWNILPF